MDCVIFGSGGFAREVAGLIRRCTWDDPEAHGYGQWAILGFLDDDAVKHGATVGGLPVLGGADWLAEHPGMRVALGVGSPAAKRAIVDRLRPFGACFPSFVHPSADIGSRVTRGEGVIVCANVVLTCDIAIGDFAAFNLAATVGHDAEIGAYCTVAPGCNLSGYTVLEEGVEFGTNVATLPGVRVGAGTIVGAGAVVTKDLPPGVVAVGTPAKPRSS